MPRSSAGAARRATSKPRSASSLTAPPATRKPGAANIPPRWKKRPPEQRWSATSGGLSGQSFLTVQHLPQLGDFRPDHDAAISLVRILFEVVLVIIFRFPEFFQRHDLCGDRIGAIFLRRGLGLF